MKFILKPGMFVVSIKAILTVFPFLRFVFDQVFLIPAIAPLN